MDERDRVGVTGDTGPDGIATIPIPYAHDVLPGAIFLGQAIDPRGDEQWEDLDPFVATCTRNEGAEDVPVGEDGPNSIAVDALVDDAITCIWYNLPPAEEPEPPTPTPTATPEPEDPDPNPNPDPDPTPTAPPATSPTPEVTLPIVKLPSTGTGG
ncbi:MAG: hypothetical protein ACRDJH_26855 [Thermomicrobiales bacterium]